jgi:exodeoxyribonuclease VII large subunit
VVAEISELKVNFSGHCYLELVEKEMAGDSIKARARTTIWSSVYRVIRPYFETTTGTQLTAGMKVMVRVTVEFHEIYGFSLNIIDIEPSYTLGEMARQRQEIINRLQAEGVFDMNKSRILPELPRRIAVISSGTAAGLGDFMDQLVRNAFGYKFYVKLFPAVMQGEEAEKSIIAALDSVFACEAFFDAVAIIRGGGSQSELSCFNTYWLAYHICQFPLPVLTGIGHEQDETISDLVAHTRLKTPTAVAEFLISMFRQADEKINELSLALTDMAQARVEKAKGLLEKYLVMIKPASKEWLIRASHRLVLESVQIRESSLALLRQEKHRLEMLDKRNTYLDPFLILKRGYSVTYYLGKALKDPATVPENSNLTTRLAGGILKSKTT